jgi:hypothetical protein
MRLDAIGWVLIVGGVLPCIGGLVIIGTDGIVRFVSGHAPHGMMTSFWVMAVIVGIVFAVAGTFSINRTDR